MRKKKRVPPPTKKQHPLATSKPHIKTTHCAISVQS